MDQLVRTTLELEQYECQGCGKFIYINKMDSEAMKQESFLPDCPFECTSGMTHRRTIITEVREVIDVVQPKICAECGESFIPTPKNKVLCEECLGNGKLYIGLSETKRG